MSTTTDCNDRQRRLHVSTYLTNKACHSKDHSEKTKLFTHALEVAGDNSYALTQAGFFEMGNNRDERAFILLERALDPSNNPSIPRDTPQARLLSGWIARYNIDKHNYRKGRDYLTLSLSCRTAYPSLAQQVQLATLITGYPTSTQDALDTISMFHQRVDCLLQQDTLDIGYVQDQDPYNFCVLTAFYVEIYHETDMRSVMQKFYRLSTRLFPSLNYVSPWILDVKPPPTQVKNKRYLLGIASACFSENHSVISDFQGVLDRLPMEKYDITYIYIKKGSSSSTPFLDDKKNVLIYDGTMNNWLEEARIGIESLQLDLLLYLDSTMSNYCPRLMMSKLARVQAVTHGHPVTTGIPRRVVDYYVSWEGAELDLKTAQSHYTEELILLPKDSMHQYYSRRTEGGCSLIDHQRYDGLTRNDFSDVIPEDGNWYLCMQKSFKRHPDFDMMLKGIMEGDGDARLILHRGDNDETDEIIRGRFRNIGMDLSRIHLIDAQPHHRLMALYILSDVNLDSYHAGGCTTTREALEVGGLVVTLPTNYLGGRWSLAYYNIMGLMDLVTTSREEYVNVAVGLGRNPERRRELKDKILGCVGNLFHRDEAVDAWDSAIERMIID